MIDGTHTCDLDDGATVQGVRSGNWRNMEPVMLPEMRWITEPALRTNHGPSAMIMDRTNIIIKNNTIALSNNRKRSTISGINRHRGRKQAHRMYE
jgi:hypothetical protein